MSVRTFSAASALRALAALSAAALAGLSAGLASAPEAVAGEDPFGVSAPDHVRHHRPARTAPPPAYPRPAIVSGYLPRNNNVPMYNEPPPRGSAW